MIFDFKNKLILRQTPIDIMEQSYFDSVKVIPCISASSEIREACISEHHKEKIEKFSEHMNLGNDDDDDDDKKIRKYKAWLKDHPTC